MKKKKVNINACSMFVTKGTIVSGSINSQGDIYIEGSVDGHITCSGVTYIETASVIHAQIRCTDLVVNGELNGNLSISRSIEVSSTGRVFGNITCEELLIDEGAIYRGEIDIVKKTTIS